MIQGIGQFTPIIEVFKNAQGFLVVGGCFLGIFIIGVPGAYISDRERILDETYIFLAIGSLSPND